MAKTKKKEKVTTLSTNISPITNGWAGQVLRTLVSVFVIAIVFGVFLYATVVTNNNFLASQPYTYSASTSASTNAVGIIAANTISVTFTGDYANFSSATPLTLTITGNQVNAYATNTVYATQGTGITQTYTITSPTATQTLTSTQGNFFNISSVTLSSPSPSFIVGTVGAAITETYLGATHGSVPWANTVVTTTASGTLNTAAQKIAGATPSSIYTSLVAYLVTLANFVGIIILLVIIMIVILVIYALFAPIGGVSMGTGNGI